jgi:hypothetical protein
MPVLLIAKSPIIQSGMVKTINAITENPAAIVLSIPKILRPTTQKN